MKKIYLALASIAFMFSTSTYAYRPKIYKSGSDWINLNFGVDYNIPNSNMNNVFTNFKYGHIGEYGNGFGVDAKYGFKNNDISYWKLGVEYIREISLFYFNAGLGYTQYKYKDEFEYDIKKAEGCELKVGFGINIPIVKNLFMNIGIDASNCINNKKNSFKNTNINPYAGLKLLF